MFCSLNTAAITVSDPQKEKHLRFAETEEQNLQK